MATGQGNAKGTTAHTEADGHGKAGFPPFQKESFASQLVSFAIAFCAALLHCAQLALPRASAASSPSAKADRRRSRRGAEAERRIRRSAEGYETEPPVARAKAQVIGRNPLRASTRRPRATARRSRPASPPNSPTRKRPLPRPARRRWATSARSHPMRRLPSCSASPVSRRTARLSIAQSKRP